MKRPAPTIVSDLACDNALRVAAIALLLLIAVASGCASTGQDQARSAGLTPYDFSLEVLIDGDPATTDPRALRSRYVVEPDGTLRVGLGDNVAAATYPRRLRDLTAHEFDTLYRIVADQHLDAAPTSDAVRDAFETGQPPYVMMQVRTTGWGDTHEYITTPQESPGTMRLIEYLCRLRGANVPTGPIVPRVD